MYDSCMNAAMLLALERREKGRWGGVNPHLKFPKKISILECRGFPSNRRNMSCSCKLWERKKWGELNLCHFLSRFFGRMLKIIVLLAWNMKCCFCKVGSSARWEYVLCKQWGGGNCHLFSGFPFCKRWGIQFFRFEYGRPANVNRTLFAQC